MRLNEKEVDRCHFMTKPLSDADIETLEWALDFMKNYEKRKKKQ